MIVGNAIYLGGTPLPDLNNPAVAGDIRLNKQAIDGDGALLTGSMADYAGQTSTGAIVPVDTGANGLYKGAILGYYPQRTIYDTELTDIFSLSAIAYGASYNYRDDIYFAEFENVTLLGGHSISIWIQKIKFNKTVTLNADAFRANSSPKIMDFAGISTNQYSTFVFRDCLATALIVRSDVLCPVVTGNFFSNSTFNIFVPPTLVDTYKEATNWTTVASRINPFYIAQTVADIQTLLDDVDVPIGAMIICDSADYTQKYTVKS